MDYKTLVETVSAMNDEQLYRAAKKISEERKRREMQAAAAAVPAGGKAVVMDTLPNEVRDNLRHEVRTSHDSLLASLLDQTKDYPEALNEDFVMDQLRLAVVGALIYEARVEMKRRLDSVK